MHYNQKVDAEKLKELENDYDAIFLGIGLGATRSLSIPGEDLENALGATEFIEEVKINPLENSCWQKSSRHRRWKYSHGCSFGIGSIRC